MLVVYNFASGGKKNDQHTEGPEHLKKTSRNPEYLQRHPVIQLSTEKEAQVYTMQLFSH